MQHYIDSVTSYNGDKIANATITVTDLSGNAVTIYTDVGGTLPVSSVKSNNNGEFDFYIPVGRYNITVSGAGITTYTLSDVFIYYSNNDPTSISNLTATGTIALNTTTNNQSYTTTGAGTITVSSGTTGSINNMNIGATTAGTGAFTTLSASSTVSGAGFSTYLASPPAIGGTSANAGTFTNLTYTGTLTGSTGIMNIGSGQLYKDASGNVGINTASPTTTLSIASVGGSQKRALFISSGNGAGSAGGVYITSATNAGGNGAVYEAVGQRNDANGSAQFSGTVGLARLRTDAAISTSGVSLGRMIFGGNPTGTALSNILYSAQIAGVSDTAWSSSSAMGTALVFYTGASGIDINSVLTDAGAEKVRIDSAGNVGIGTSSPATYGKLAVQGVSGSNTASFLSGSAGIFGAISIGRTANEFSLATVAAANNFFSGTSSGDSVIAYGTGKLFIGGGNTGVGGTLAAVFDASGNVLIGTTAAGTTAAKVLGLGNATAPTTSPAGMGQLYVEAGALKYRGSSGTITTLAVA